MTSPFWQKIRDRRRVSSHPEQHLGLSQGVIITSEAESYGLFNFTPDRPATDFGIDIVAVHGLGGHYEKTWMDDGGKLWLRDFLPSQLTNARVLSYGYNSRTAFTKSVTDVEDEAAMLLDRIDGERSLPEERTRPIIFVAHSLGGIVVKKALILSHERSSIYGELLDNVRGAIFFGVPHRGSNVAYWGTFAANVLSSAQLGLGVNPNFVQALQRNSKSFADISQQFIERGAQLQIRTFYETEKTRNILIVDKDSARLSLPNEISVGVAGSNHRNICRFSAPDSQKYAPVWKAAKRMADSVVGEFPAFTPDEQACLYSLSFREMGIRRESIESPLGKTCTWLFDRPSFRRWLNCDTPDAHDRLLWIKGKPGTGKSTLIKSALQYAERCYPRDAIAAHFFNAGGHPLEKSLIGLFRSILHQMLSRTRALLRLFLPLFEEKLVKHGLEWDWQLPELQDFFLGYIACSKERRTIMFIDALDECNENEVRRFVAFAEKLTAAAVAFGSQLTICLSSRHFPNVRIGKYPSLSVEHYNNSDISAYICEKLEHEISEEAYQTLHPQIVAKASGVFLWVVLVVGTLIKAEDDGESLKRMQDRINRVPSELGALFAQTLKRVDPRDLPTTVRMMQWVLFAEEPLALTDFCSALATGTGLSGFPESDLLDLGSAQQEKFIRSKSGGLIEVEKAQFQHRDLNTVQFIHESIRDFLLDSDGFAILDPSLADQAVGKCHDQLTKSCINYISHIEACVTPSRDSTSCSADKEAFQSVSFGYYASDYVFQHAEKAEADGIEQVHLIKSFHTPSTRLFDCWWYLTADRKGFILQEPQPSLLQVASYHNLLSCVRLLLDLGAPVNIEGGREYPTAIVAAVSRGHHAIVNLLLQHGADTRAKSYAGEPLFHLALRLGWSKDDTSKRKSGHVRASPEIETRERMIHLLVSEGADVNATDKEGNSALHLSIILSQRLMTRLLLENRADANLINVIGQSPLQLALLQSDDDIARLLLEHGANVNQRGRWGEFPLHLAAGKGAKMMRLLLARGADVHAKAKNGTTTLHHTAAVGDEEGTSILLIAGAEVSEPDLAFQTPLHLAAVNNHPVVVRKLLESGADPTARDYKGITPLVSAVENNSVQATILLLGGVSDPALIGKDEALHEAVTQNNDGLVALLLERNTDINTPDAYGRTPLYHATDHSRSKILNLLLKHNGIDVMARDTDGKTPLHQAARSHNPSAVQQLLAHGADVGACDTNQETALHAAASQSSMVTPDSMVTVNSTAAVDGVATIRLLLQHHADINAKNSFGETPLHEAARSGNTSLMQFLESSGADVLARNGQGMTPSEMLEEKRANRAIVVPAFLARERKPAG